LDLEDQINKLIDEIIRSKQSTVISSHLVHKKGSEYLCNFEYDRRANAISYIHLLADPQQIFEQRRLDNGLRKKQRIEDSIESISEHQEISLKKTIEICDELVSDLLLIHNTGDLDRNLETMNTFFNHYLGKT